MSTHKVEVPLTVTVVMEEMDGTADQSAEIAMDLIKEQIKDWDGNAKIEFGFVKVKDMVEIKSTVFSLNDGSVTEGESEWVERRDS